MSSCSRFLYISSLSPTGLSGSVASSAFINSKSSSLPGAAGTLLIWMTYDSNDYKRCVVMWIALISSHHILRYIFGRNNSINFPQNFHRKPNVQKSNFGLCLRSFGLNYEEYIKLNGIINGMCHQIFDFEAEVSIWFRAKNWTYLTHVNR